MRTAKNTAEKVGPREWSGIRLPEGEAADSLKLVFQAYVGNTGASY
jgi:hypothetical protein